MHVCGWEFEGVFEAFWFDFAVFAEGSCFGYVGDVFVFFGEHEVGLVFAVSFVHPGVSVYSK